MPRPAKLFLTLAAATAAASAAGAAAAAEGGQSPYLKGYRDIYAGIVPPYPGWYLRNDTIYYGGDMGRAVLGGRVEAGLDLSLAVNATSANLVTDKTIFGGRYAFGVILPLVYADVDAEASVTGPLGQTVRRTANDNATGIADIAVAPITLGWHSGNLYTNAGIAIYLPTGPYRKGRLANLSKNYVTIQPSVAVSWMEPKSKWDVSAALSYVMTTENPATQYDTGDLLHLDAAVTKGVGAWRLGLVGYAMIQTTGDSGPGALLGDFKSEVYGFGPVVTYDAKIGGRPVTFYGKWYREFGAHHTSEGDTIAASFSFKF